MRYTAIIACVLSFFTFSFSAAENQSPQTQKLNFPERTIDDWSIEKAIVEANDDIKKGTIKIYYSGTIAAYPPGVNQEDMHLIEGLSIANAGIGCKVFDSKLRKSQFNYANKYNEIIIDHLKSK
jgi:hypothetical protein